MGVLEPMPLVARVSTEDIRREAAEAAVVTWATAGLALGIAIVAISSIVVCTSRAGCAGSWGTNSSALQKKNSGRY